MSRIVATLNMSADGIVRSETRGVQDLYAWYYNGLEEVPTANPDVAFQMSPANRQWFEGFRSEGGAIIVDEIVFSEAQGWGGLHPFGLPIVVTTERGRPDWFDDANGYFAFVTGGIVEAIEVARGLAGERNVYIPTAKHSREALEAGLVDSVLIGLVPVLLGQGTHIFHGLSAELTRLSEPTVVLGDGITFIRYDVVK